MTFRLVASLVIFTLLTNVVSATSPKKYTFIPPSTKFVGGVYVMTNDVDRNSILAYGRRSNGTIEPLGTFRTFGKGAVLDDLDGVDPLFSAYSVIVTPDNRFLLAVNAGSASVSVFRILPNFMLALISVKPVSGFGPVSVAYSRGTVYVSSIVASTSLPPNSTAFELMGVLTGYRLTRSGSLKFIRGSTRRLSNRPSAIQFSPDGRSLVVSSLAAGSVELNSTSVDEISVFRVFGRRLSRKPISTATSTQVNNEEGRSLPGAIGFDTVRIGDVQYVVVPEPRFIGSDGSGLVLQASSVSIWRLTSSQMLIPVQLDVLVGTSVDEGQLTSCWIQFSKTNEYFWLANTVSGTLSAFSFAEDGRATLVEEVAANAPAPIDLWSSRDGKFIYQLSNGAIDVFEVENEGRGSGLTHIQTVGEDIPEMNVQGIAAV